MSVDATPATSSIPYGGYKEEDRGLGWVLFAGVLLLPLGTVNAIEGFAAIDILAAYGLIAYGKRIGEG